MGHWRRHDKTLAEVRRGDVEGDTEALRRLISELRQSRITLLTPRVNEQHFEAPPAFFRLVLGPRMKDSSGLWHRSTQALAEAENAMLSLTCERAHIEDGLEILEPACG